MDTEPSGSPSATDAAFVEAGPRTAVPVRLGRRGGIAGFIVRRVLLGILVLFLVSIVVFAATQALPGDPARAILGRTATPASLKALREQLHLNRTVFSQYFTWITGMLHGDLGTSLAAQVPVSQLLSGRMVHSAFLVLCAGLISIPFSIAIGSYAALRRVRTFDVAASIVTLLFAALPEFVVGVSLVVLLATTVFHVLPAISLIAPGTKPWTQPKSLILPTLTLIIAVTPYVARIMRASMIEVLESDYVEMARLKGLPERIVIRRHALPNALGPTFQVIAINLAYLAGGVIVVEYIFNYAGIGGALRGPGTNPPHPVVQGAPPPLAPPHPLLNPP